MPELPRISGDQAITGFKQIAMETLRSAIKQAGITVEEFVATYEKK